MQIKSMIKAIAHLACFAPLGYLVYAVNNRLLGGDPQESVLHLLGYWSMLFLLLCLTVTPLKQITKQSQLLHYRRMLGLYCVFYLVLHLTMFFIFYLESNLYLLWQEVVERPYITLGMAASLMLIPLTVTSTKKMQRLLGRRWKKIHWMIYPIALMALGHFIWQSKADLNEPLTYMAWLLILLGYRLYRRFIR
jgi:sulfoxide reductase heme-binding subunit YedZ